MTCEHSLGWCDECMGLDTEPEPDYNERLAEGFAQLQVQENDYNGRRNHG